tara:strand:- start:170 stop:304 length:135 start_codon:yes stop_codon:yes gene_type:complete
LGNSFDEENINQEEREEDSAVDMWCSVALVILAWAIAMHWLMGT